MNELIPRFWFSDFDRLFDRAFGPSRAFDWSESRWLSVDAFEKDGNLHLRLDVPGIDPKDVEVTLHRDTLTIRADRKVEHERKGGYREVRYGRFERAFTVPPGVDAEKIKARYASGVLELTVPLPAAAKARTVPIEVEAEKKKAA